MRLNAIMLAVLVGGQAFAAAAQPAIANQRSIIVDGYGEVKTNPDLATISYTLRGEGVTSDEAVRAMVVSGARIEAALRGIDPAVDPQTSKVEVSPARSADCKASDEDSSAQLSKGACAIVGYVATQSVTVDTADVKDAGTMTGLAGRGGAFDARVDSFDLKDSRAAKARAIAAALVDAQAKAVAIATGTHVTLGPILSAATGDRSVTTITSQEVKLDVLPPVYANAPPPVPVNVKPEPITTNANVTVTYAIGQ